VDGEGLFWYAPRTRRFPAGERDPAAKIIHDHEKTMTGRLHVSSRVVLLLTAALAACSGKPGRGDGTATTRDSAAGSVDPAQTDTAYGPANLMGRIPVLEYHVIGSPNAAYTQTPEVLRANMEMLYKRGYRPITIAQLLDKNFSAVPAGMSPVVFVFDDASTSQFRYIDKGNGNLEIDPTSGIGVWNDFAKSHPGWTGKATFCMLNGGASGHNFFGDGPKWDGQHQQWRLKKVKWLADNGFELCDHTLWHMQLSKYPDAAVQEQIARNAMGIDSAVPGYKIRTMALPQGLWPKNRPLAWQGSWTNPKTGQTINYHFDAVLEVAGGPTRSPFDPAFDPHSITRVQATGNGVQSALDQLDHTKTRFVK
jgi:hypothetical protein